MKKHLILAGLVAFFAAPAFAQSGTVTVKDPATGAKSTTEVKVRDNGTVKVEKETRTGRTEAGEAVNDAAQGTKHVAKKVANGTEKAAHKTGHAVKKVAKKTGNAVEKGAEKTGDAVKDAVD